MIGKNRYVNTFFWEDKYIKRLDLKHKLVFLNMLTSPMSNILGIYEITLDRIAYDTSIPLVEVETIIATFVKDKKIMYDDDYIVILNFSKHQKKTAIHIQRGMQKIALTLPEDIQRKYVQYNNDDTVEVGMFGTQNGKNKNKPRLSSIHKKKISESHPEVYKALFEKDADTFEPLRYVKDNDDGSIVLFSPTKRLRDRIMNDDVVKEFVMEQFGCEIEILTDEV